MSRTKIKICGVKEPDHARAAIDAGADMIGLVFVEKSPRHVTHDQACSIVQVLDEQTQRVGLFVDASADTIKRTAADIGLDTAQLHGEEDPAILKQLEGLRIWKALPFDNKLIERAAPWDQDERVEALLIDTPPKGELTGGSGVVFDWNALAEIKDKLTKPIILAGGLTPENVVEAIRVVKPYTVDVSSGVESSRGMKDVSLIKAFCEAVHAADDTIAAL